MPSALTKPIYKNVIRYVGDPGTPSEIQRRRRWSLETLRRLGTPVLLKHKYNIDDVAKGIATESPNFDTIYKQPTHDDPISYGCGYVSVETQEGEWINENGELVIAEKGEEGWIPAPRYRGWGPGYLTYAIIPDAPEDVFRLTQEGALLHTEISRTMLPWYPLCGDNDLMITCEIDRSEKIIQTFDRYELKKVQPITMRGRDRLGYRETETVAAGNRYWINGYCEASRVLDTDPIYQVESDR